MKRQLTSLSFLPIVLITSLSVFTEPFIHTLAWAQKSEVDVLPKPVAMDPIDQLVARFWAPPQLQELVGMPFIKVGQSDGSVRQLKEGEEFKENDRFQTSDTGAMRILFLDGSQALVGRSTAVSTRFEDPVVEKTEEDFVPIRVPMVYLLTGTARFLIPENKSQFRKAGLKSANHVFVVETKYGWVGVRGTDFIVTVGENGMGVFCFSGQVEVAKTYSDLKKFKATLLNPKQRTHIHKPGSSPTPPIEFGPTEILSTLDSAHPEIKKLWVASTSLEAASKYEAYIQDRLGKKLDELAKEAGIPLSEIHKRTGRMNAPMPSVAGKVSAPNPQAQTDANLKTPNRRKTLGLDGKAASAQEVLLGRKWTKITSAGMTLEIPEPPAMADQRPAKLDPHIAVTAPKPDLLSIPARPVPQGQTPAYPPHRLDD